MLPQILIASYIRKKAIRKWVWVIGSVLQFFAIGTIGLIALVFTGTKAGIIIIGLLIIYSLSRGLCSVASKDVLGKTIPKTRRGRLKGYSTSASGILVLGAGLFLIYKSSDTLTIDFYSNLLIFAGVLWLVAAVIYANIKEFPGVTDEGNGGLKEAFSRLSILRTDRQFRNFVIARALLLCSALTAPFYVLLAQNNVGSEGYLLGIFIIVNGLAAIISAPVLGKMADKSSRRVMVLGGVAASVLGLLVVTLFILLPGIKGIIWFYPVVVFILAVAHSAVRIGRKTYVLDMAVGNKRTDYVAVSNTVIGGILLVTGGISALASLVSIEGIILVLSLFGVAGSIASAKLPNVEKG
jgi:MFS family permease